MMDISWMSESACQNMIDECTRHGCDHANETCPQYRTIIKMHNIFFPDGDGPTVYSKMQKAVEVCMQCPVAEECLTWASESPHSWSQGVYGGLRPSERLLDENDEPDLEAALRSSDLKFLAKKKAS
jgi:hypothetical protein